MFAKFSFIRSPLPRKNSYENEYRSSVIASFPLSAKMSKTEAQSLYPSSRPCTSSPKKTLLNPETLLRVAIVFAPCDSAPRLLPAVASPTSSSPPAQACSHNSRNRPFASWHRLVSAAKAQPPQSPWSTKLGEQTCQNWNTAV